MLPPLPILALPLASQHKSVLGMLQTSPSPLPVDFGQGQAQCARVLAWPTHSKYVLILDWSRLARVTRSRFSRFHSDQFYFAQHHGVQMSQLSTCLKSQVVARIALAPDLKQRLRVAALHVLASLQLPANAAAIHNKHEQTITHLCKGMRGPHPPTPLLRASMRINGW